MSTNAVNRYKFEYYLENAFLNALNAYGLEQVLIMGDTRTAPTPNIIVTASIGNTLTDYGVTIPEINTFEFTRYNSTLTIEYTVPEQDANGNPIDIHEETAKVRAAMSAITLEDINADLPLHFVDMIQPTGTNRTANDQNHTLLTFSYYVRVEIKPSAFE